MKGCFNFIKFVVLTIAALIIMFPCGGLNYIKGIIDSQLHPKKTEITMQAKKLADFSKLPKEFELLRTVNMFGVNAVIAQHNQTSQKMALVDTGWIVNVSKNDIKTNNIVQQLQKTAAQYVPQVKLNQIEIVDKGTFKAIGQDIPYLHVKVNLANTTQKNLEGIIGVANISDKKNDIVLAINEPGKYKQNITENFFKSVKLNKIDN
ncbi:MAG: hypothetical protein PHC34_08780 [Candidatus Gastranaerophilales bacterium]|nr:hypothetical protein [Candidatus Gastranaerophilales bacterium]